LRGINLTQSEGMLQQPGRSPAFANRGGGQRLAAQSIDATAGTICKKRDFIPRSLIVQRS
jgi:hypothetical protein